MALSFDINALEKDKFESTINDKTAVRVIPKLGSDGQPFPVVDQSLLGTSPIVFNVDAPTAMTELSLSLPEGTKKFILKSRKVSSLLVYWVSPMVDYITVPLGGFYSRDALKLSGATVYFQSSIGNNVIEVEAWT